MPSRLGQSSSRNIAITLPSSCSGIPTICTLFLLPWFSMSSSFSKTCCKSALVANGLAANSLSDDSIRLSASLILVTNSVIFFDVLQQDPPSLQELLSASQTCSSVDAKFVLPHHPNRVPGLRDYLSYQLEHHKILQRENTELKRRLQAHGEIYFLQNIDGVHVYENESDVDKVSNSGQSTSQVRFFSDDDQVPLQRNF
ncbi:uncharacterized protein LOC127619087 isoform X4 [Xyrauchen texanus]|uniref:uncharacterized protein LOC127619087 isoform X4 n=1 Tax=Xyrauchen texanus TaxID=154827 RepID=UPI002242AC71|nr:uncharacterized protein LOC127619087 isoform X4 [Xyrauchen texanus]